MSDRLYMAAHVDGEPQGHYDFENDLWVTDFPEPAGWREFALERWGSEPDREHETWPNGYKPFFFPKTGVVYKSRSSAQRRVDIINFWGGKAEVLECTPVWESVDAANARRAAARINSRIVKKRAELAALEAQHDAALGYKAAA